MRKNILIVDDDVAFANQVRNVLEGVYQVELCHSIAEFRKRFGVGRYHLVIMDMRLEKGHEGIQLLREIVLQDQLQPVIIVTAYADTETYLQALEAGALTYLDKHEFTPTLIARMVEGIIQQGQLQERVFALEQELALVEPVELIGASLAIAHVRRQVQLAAADEVAPILLRGERGVGKELVARNLHQMSRSRRSGPFVAARMPVGNDEKQTDVLFGTEDKNGNLKRGRFDAARNGTLFVEEVCHLGRLLQDLLLKALKSGRYKYKGGKHEIDSGARVVLATSVPLDEALRQGKFSPILYKMVSRVELEVPTLRERAEDIPLLAQYFLLHLFRQGKTTARSFIGKAIERLQVYHWPGNIEELRIVVEYAGLQSGIREATDVAPQDLPGEIGSSGQVKNLDNTRMDYKYHVARAELNLVNSARRMLNFNNKSKIATALGYNDRFTFTRRIKRALESFPELRQEFPDLANQFLR